ncbi:MAG: 7TM-DISM domain-containing protein, partial [Bacteroidota bacterium]
MQKAAGQNPVLIDASFEKHQFAIDELHILRDPSGSLKLSDILEAENQKLFVPPPSENLNFGYTSDAIWLKFKVQSTPKTQQQYCLLEVDYPVIDSLTFAKKDQGGLWDVYVMGDKIPFRERRFKHQNAIFQVDLTDTVSTNYLRIRTEGTVIFPLLLQTPEVFQERDSLRELFYGIVYGIMFIMMVYNFMLYLSLKQRTYLYYTLTILGSLVLQASLSGHTIKWFWGN